MNIIFLQNTSALRWSIVFRGPRVVATEDVICSYMLDTDLEEHLDFVGKKVTALLALIRMQLTPDYLFVKSSDEYDEVECVFEVVRDIESVRTMLAQILRNMFADWQIMHGAVPL